MHKFSKSNRRVFLTQELKNNYPLESRARVHPHSVADQLFNPPALEVSSLGLEIDRYYSNFIPTLMDHEEIDVVYKCPNIVSKNTEDYLISGEDFTSTDKIPLQSSLSDINDFWYSKLPTRFTSEGEYYRTIYPSKTASIDFSEKYLSFESYNQYFIDYSDELENAEIISDLSLRGTDDTSFFFKRTSSSTNEDGVILFSFYEHNYNPEIERIEYEYGIEGVGTNYSTDTNLEYGYYKQKSFFFDAAGMTGFPFFKAQYFCTSYQDLDVEVTGLYAKDIYQDFLYTSNRIHFPPTLHKQLPQKAFVKLENGKALTNPNSKIPSAVSGLIIKGINRRGHFDEEFLFLTHNGTHEGFKQWYSIKEATPYYLNKDALLTIQLQDYQTTDYYFDPTQRFIDSFGDNYLFRKIRREEGDSYLEFASYDSPNSQVVEDFLPKKRKEIVLKKGNGGAILADDYTFDFKNQLVWVLSEGSLYLFDLLEHQISKEGFDEYKKRTSDTAMIIREDQDSDNTALLGEVKRFQARWNNRYYYLRRYRWGLKTPSGTIYNIRTDGSLVAPSPLEWIENDSLFSEKTQEWVFEPPFIEVLFDEFGEYTLYLEGEMLEEDTNRSFFHRDVQVIGVFKKTALLEYPLSGSPIGITLSGDDDLLIAYESDIPFTIKEVKLRPRYDYYFVSENNQEITFRENYRNIYFTLTEDEDGEVCKKTILLKTTSDPLTSGQVDCYFIIVNSSSGAISFALPTITSDLDGATIIIKRLGVNNVTINAGGGNSIDGDPSLTLYSNYDAITLTASHSLSMWAIS